MNLDLFAKYSATQNITKLSIAFKKTYILKSVTLKQKQNMYLVLNIELSLQKLWKIDFI